MLPYRVAVRCLTFILLVGSLPTVCNGGVAAVGPQNAGMELLILGMDDSATTDWVGAAALQRMTRERYVVTYEEKAGWGDRVSKAILGKRLFGQRLAVSPLIQPDHVIHANLDDPESIKRLQEIGRNPSVTVFIDPDLAVYALTPANWNPQTKWEGRVAAILAESHRERYPDSSSPTATVNLLSHSQGTEGAVAALKIEQEVGRHLFDHPTVASPRDLGGLREVSRKDITVIVADGDYFASPHGWPTLRTIKAKDLPGYTVIRVEDRQPLANRLLNRVPVLSADHPHHRVRDLFTPDRDLTIYPPDGGAPVTCRNTSLGDAMKAVRSASGGPGQCPVATAESLQGAIRTMQSQQPTQGIGGISLGPIAEMPVTPSDVSSAGYDTQKRRLYLSMADGRLLPLPPMEPEVLRLAYQAGYVAKSKPELSIGGTFLTPEGEELVDLHGAGEEPVHYLGDTLDTMLGLVMYQADEALAKLVFGRSDVIGPVAERVPGFESLPELYPEKYSDNSGSDADTDIRVFLEASSVEYALSARSDALEFGDLRFALHFPSMGPAEAAFAASFQSHLEELVDTKEGAPLGRLIPYARAIAVFRWLQTHRIPFAPGALTQVPVADVLTPTETAAIGLPSLEQISPRRPLVFFGPFGPTRFIHADGRQTVVTYRHGLPAQVRRYDGAALDVFRDELGQPVAVRVGRSESAAFLVDQRLGLVYAENVQLDDTAQGPTVHLREDTVIYPETRPESTISSIIADFLRQEALP